VHGRVRLQPVCSFFILGSTPSYEQRPRGSCMCHWGGRHLCSAPVCVGPNSIWPGGLGHQLIDLEEVLKKFLVSVKTEPRWNGRARGGGGNAAYSSALQARLRVPALQNQNAMESGAPVVALAPPGPPGAVSWVRCYFLKGLLPRCTYGSGRAKGHCTCMQVHPRAQHLDLPGLPLWRQTRSGVPGHQTATLLIQICALGALYSAALSVGGKAERIGHIFQTSALLSCRFLDQTLNYLRTRVGQQQQQDQCPTYHVSNWPTPLLGACRITLISPTEVFNYRRSNFKRHRPQT
jgi:hypothetical protein